MGVCDFERIWRELLPANVVFSSGAEPVSGLLSSTERGTLGEVGERRLREFVAGRWHAKRALAGLGLVGVDLPRGAKGAPVWPDGVIGSIAHSWCGDAIAVVAAAVRANERAAIGVDLEAPGRLEPRAWPTLLSSAQMDSVLMLPVAQRNDRVRALWCAKEAVSKTGGATSELSAIELDDDGCFENGHHTGRVRHEYGWTFCVAQRVQT